MSLKPYIWPIPFLLLAAAFLSAGYFSPEGIQQIDIDSIIFCWVFMAAARLMP